MQHTCEPIYKEQHQEKGNTEIRQLNVFTRPKGLKDRN